LEAYFNPADKKAFGEFSADVALCLLLLQLLLLLTDKFRKILLTIAERHLMVIHCRVMSFGVKNVLFRNGCAWKVDSYFKLESRLRDEGA
jgi:hypothetical protein